MFGSLILFGSLKFVEIFHFLPMFGSLILFGSLKFVEIFHFLPMFGSLILFGSLKFTGFCVFWVFCLCLDRIMLVYDQKPSNFAYVTML
jgi:hypothetical protein